MRSILSAGAAALAAAALVPAGAAAAHPRPAGAVFVQTDGLAGNEIAAYARAADGTLTPAGRYPTGGLGGQLAGSVVDHTASQGALTLDPAHRRLYAVNAGSDTVTVFAVDGTRLRRLQVLPSGGSFPVSVTAHGGEVYVLNALAGGAIQGFAAGSAGLRSIRGSHRDLGLGVTADPQFTHTPGQVAFTPDGRGLVVTTKASTNSVLVYGIGRDGRPSAEPATTVLTGAVPFAVGFDRAGRLLLAEAGPSAVARFAIGSGGRLAALGSVATGQAATCWVTVVGDVAFASNAGSASVTGVRTTGAAPAVIGSTASGAGTVDSAASPDGRQLFVQGGAAGTVTGFAVHAGGTLTTTGTVTVPGAAGGEGIAVS